MHVCIPRVPRGSPNEVDPGAAHRELDGLRLAEDDAPGPFQQADESSLAADEVGHVQVGARRCRHALDREQVLDRHRNAHQRSQIGAGSEQAVQRPGLCQRALAGDVLIGSEAGIQYLYPLQIGANGCLGGRLPGAKTYGESTDSRGFKGIGGNAGRHRSSLSGGCRHRRERRMPCPRQSRSRRRRWTVRPRVEHVTPPSVSANRGICSPAETSLPTARRR